MRPIQWLCCLAAWGGHDARVAYGAEAAISLAIECKPDVILLDIGMPGMNGYEVARQLRTTPTVQDGVIIAVTGYGRESDRAKSLAAGIDLHLLKPVDTRELLRYLGAHWNDGFPAAEQNDSR